MAIYRRLFGTSGLQDRYPHSRPRQTQPKEQPHRAGHWWSGRGSDDRPCQSSSAKCWVAVDKVSPRWPASWWAKVALTTVGTANRAGAAAA